MHLIFLLAIKRVYVSCYYYFKHKLHMHSNMHSNYSNLNEHPTLVFPNASASHFLSTHLDLNFHKCSFPLVSIFAGQN